MSGCENNILLFHIQLVFWFNIRLLIKSTPLPKTDSHIHTSPVNLRLIIHQILSSQHLLTHPYTPPLYPYTSSSTNPSPPTFHLILHLHIFSNFTPSQPLYLPSNINMLVHSPSPFILILIYPFLPHLDYIHLTNFSPAHQPCLSTLSNPPYHLSLTGLITLYVVSLAFLIFFLSHCHLRF